MCGINGIYSYREALPVDAAELEAVSGAMLSRGPDAGSIWISQDQSIGFGHRRLSIIDLSETANQPMHSHDRTLTITYNGEIYNYRNLRTELEAEGHHFRTQSDTEVILAVYEYWGPPGFARMRGMFAFGIWDQNKRCLVLARGPMGIKPLYVADDGKSIRFASQVKALLRGQGIDCSPDPAGHVGFFLWGHIPEPYTLHRGIQQLPAGSYQVFDENGARPPKRYFRLADCFGAESPARNASTLREALEDTASAHFVSDVPVSVFLSAGKDSSTLLAFASQAEKGAIHAVTLAFEEFRGTQLDESPAAAEIANLYGARHTIHHVSMSEFRSDLDALIEAMDQPSIDGSNTYFVTKVAAQLGVKVALSGVGADEIFGGYDSFRQIPRLNRALGWSRAVPWLGRGLRNTVRYALPKGVSPKYAGLFELGGSLEGAYFLRRGLFMPWELSKMFEPGFLAEGLSELATYERLREITSGISSPHAKLVALELSAYMQPRLLRDSDWASMAHSLELRTPFVDVEIFRRLGPAIGSATPPTKSDLARAPKVAPPDAILNRPKQGFVVPIQEWVLGIKPGAAPEQSWRQWSRYVYQRVAGTDALKVHDNLVV